MMSFYLRGQREMLASSFELIERCVALLLLISHLSHVGDCYVDVVINLKSFSSLKPGHDLLHKWLYYVYHAGSGV